MSTKFVKEHWGLLAGLADEDEKELYRDISAEYVDDTFNKNIKETSFKTKFIMEQIQFDPSEDGDVESEHSMHPEKPDGYLYVDQDANDPEIYDDKLDDEKEYSHAIKIGQIKVKKEEFDKKNNDFIKKYSINEDWREIVDDPVSNTSIVKVPQGLLDLLSSWHGGQGTNSYAVLSTGRQGIPSNYIEGAIKELEAHASERYEKGILSNEDRKQLVALEKGLKNLIEDNISLHEDYSDGQLKSEKPYAITEDEIVDSSSVNDKDLVAAIRNGSELVGVSDHPDAINLDFWDIVEPEENLELVWLDDLPEQLLIKLKDWKTHFRNGKIALSAALPYMGEVIDKNGEMKDLQSEPEEEKSNKQFQKYF